MIISRRIFRFCYTVLLLAACEKKDDVIPQITLSASEVLLTDNGGTAELTITSNTDWKIIAYEADWLQFSQATGSSGSTKITVTSPANTGFATRAATALIATSRAAPVQVAIKQFSRSRTYPGYNTSPKPADATGMNSTAAQIAAKIKLGWNIGNTLEAIGGETAWGNPAVTEALIQSVKARGFSAIRIPCSWDQYANQTTAKIQDTWLSRVKTVVQYCVNNDLYVLLNIHWDGGWLERNCTPEKKDSVNDKQKAFWEQIATTLRDFDEHLLFASANEPAVENATQMDILNSYHQTFIDAVRATGGRNAYRVLVVQGPGTDVNKTVQLMSKMPSDNVANKLMLEVHYYTPYNFTLMTKDESWGKQFYYWGKDYHSATDPDRNPTWGEEALIDQEFKSIKDNFTSKGIPVILGEFTAMRRSHLTGADLQLHLDSRNYWHKYIAQRAIANGMLPFLWDTGEGVIKRADNTVLDQPLLDSLLLGAGL